MGVGCDYVGARDGVNVRGELVCKPQMARWMVRGEDDVVRNV